MQRPSRERAEAAIERFLAKALECDRSDVPSFTLMEDGDDGWAFYVLPDDTTSYVKPGSRMAANLEIEWYGTAYVASAADPDIESKVTTPAS